MAENNNGWEKPEEKFPETEFEDSFSEFFSEEELLIQLKKSEKPLVIYCFGGNRELHRILRENFPAGGIVFNDAMLHFANMHFPFGGIGNSGFGAYHGKLTFEIFCHRKPVMYKPFFPDWPPRYPDSFCRALWR